MQNDTANTRNYYNESGVTVTRYYTIFSYNESSGMYSRTGLDIPWGALGVSVFNESRPTQAITNWNISIKNNNGTEWYTAANLNNLFYLDVLLVPHSINCEIKVWKNGYNFRVQTADLYENTFFNISFFLPKNILPPGEPGGGSGGLPNESFTPLIYSVRVVETVVSPYTQADRGVKGALVTFQRYNGTIGLFTVASMLTDDNGYCNPNPYLVPSVTYQVTITKDGYTTEISDYTPLPADLYGRTEEKIFRIEKSEQEYEQYIYKNITVSITPDSREHSTNFTLYYNISSSDNKLEYFGMIISYINDSMSAWSEVYNVTTVTVSGGSLSYHVNKSGSYSVICFFKRQGFDVFYFGEPHSLYKMIYTLLNAPQIDILDEKITKVLGKSPVYVGAYIASYTAIIVGVVATLLLFSFNPRLAGLGVTGTGLTLGFMKYGFHIIPDQVMTVVQIALICILGVMLMIVLKKRS
jgi:hypothetical protein